MLMVGLALAQQPDLPEMTVESADTQWPAKVVLAADALDMEVDFIGRAWQGTEHIYGREYKQGQDIWFALHQDYPGRAVQHIGSVLVYQSRMMENWDFRGEDQYRYHSDEAIRQLEAAIEEPGNEGWEHFAMAGMLGIESINVFRKDEYVAAVGKGIDALNHIQEVKQVAPNFADIYLCDGLYKYWRTVVAQSSKAIPDGVDERQAGIADMKLAEQKAVFVGPGSSIGLTYTYIEEDQYKTALTYTSKLKQDYPSSVINLLLHARVQLYLKRYNPALKTLDQVKAVAPENQRMHYYYSTAYMKKGALLKAHASVDTYLGFSDVTAYYRGQAWHRKGDLYYRQKNFDEAEKAYKEAVRLTGYKPAKKRLEKIKEMRKAGEI